MIDKDLCHPRLKGVSFLKRLVQAIRLFVKFL